MQAVQAEEQERIRRACYIEHKSMRTIEKEMRHSRRTIAKAIAEDTSVSEHVVVCLSFTSCPILSSNISTEQEAITLTREGDPLCKPKKNQRSMIGWVASITSLPSLMISLTASWSIQD